jgi:hypothetical protein
VYDTSQKTKFVADQSTTKQLNAAPFRPWVEIRIWASSVVTGGIDTVLLSGLKNTSW